MPKISRRSVPKDDPEYRYESWIKALDVSQPKNKISRDSMSDCQNVELFVRSVKKRLGTKYFGNEKDSRTRGLANYTHSDGTKKILRSSGTTLQEYNTSTEDYDELTGKTYNSDLNTDYLLAYDNLYICNGTDSLTKYNKDDSPVITTFTSVSPPTSPTATRGAGLSTGQFKAFYKLTHFNSIGETIGTSEFTTDFDISRSAWDSATEKVALAWTNDGGDIDGTNIYYASSSGDETFMISVDSTETSYDDFGGDLEADGLTEVPETNSTGGVIGFAGTFDGTRLWIFKGSSLHYSGGGNVHIEHFDSSSGGGALNISKGDGDEIKKVLRTRDNSIIVYKEFSIWKVFFSSTGIITLRNVNNFVGCVGKRAATSVDDDQVFMSRYGAFTLGNQPNFPTDVLRVRSISFAIDDDLKSITPSNLPNVVLHYDFQRRLRIAYAEGGSTTNNQEFLFKYGGWVRNTNINANCYLNVTDVSSGTPIVEELNKQYTFYGADDEGRTILIDRGLSDRGASIDGFFDTNQDDQGKPERQKKYYDQDVEIGSLQGNLDIYQFFDSGTDIKVPITNPVTGGLGSEAIGFSEVGAENGTILANSSVTLTKRWKLSGRKQSNIRTRFRQDSANGTFAIMSFIGVYRMMSRRQYETNDIVDTVDV